MLADQITVRILISSDDVPGQSLAELVHVAVATLTVLLEMLLLLHAGLLVLAGVVHATRRALAATLDWLEWLAEPLLDSVNRGLDWILCYE